MQRMPFQRPTNHYAEGLSEIDEKIVALIKERKEVSNNNPGFPPLEDISTWSEKYGVYEDLLQSIFSTLYHEEYYGNYVEPKGFRKHLPVLKSIEIDQVLYSVPLIRQYENCSVVQLAMDQDDSDTEAVHHLEHAVFELEIGEEYHCILNGGGGSGGHNLISYTVSPPLPDNLSGITLTFKELTTKKSGRELTFHLE